MRVAGGSGVPDDDSRAGVLCRDMPVPAQGVERDRAFGGFCPDAVLGRRALRQVNRGVQSCRDPGQPKPRPGFAECRRGSLAELLGRDPADLVGLGQLRQRPVTLGVRYRQVSRRKTCALRAHDQCSLDDHGDNAVVVGCPRRQKRDSSRHDRPSCAHCCPAASGSPSGHERVARLPPTRCPASPAVPLQEGQGRWAD